MGMDDRPVTQSIAIPAQCERYQAMLTLCIFNRFVYRTSGLQGYNWVEPTVWSMSHCHVSMNFDRFHQPCLFPQLQVLG